MLTYLRKRYAKARMAAYINGEVSPATRRLIAQQIDTHDDVYRCYVQHREAKRNLERELPTFGQASETQLDSMWANIQTQLNQPEPATPAPVRTTPRYSLGYGLAMVLCVMALLLPLSMDATRAQASFTPQPQHPSPEFTEVATTPAYLRLATHVQIASVADYREEHPVPVHTAFPAHELYTTPMPETPDTR